MMPYGVAGPLIMYTPLGWNQFLTAHSLDPNFSHSAVLWLNKSPTFYYLWVFMLVMNHFSVAYTHIQAQILEYLNHIQLTSLLRTHESESSLIFTSQWNTHLSMYMFKTFCWECQSTILKFHTKHLTHTLKDTILCNFDILRAPTHFWNLPHSQSKPISRGYEISQGLMGRAFYHKFDNGLVVIAQLSLKWVNDMVLAKCEGNKSGNSNSFKKPHIVHILLLYNLNQNYGSDNR